MSKMVKEYVYFLIYLMISLILSMVIIIVTLLLVDRTNDIEKISAYECGFHPFQDTRGKFDVRFYLVAILFIVFDLEIMFLFPWCLLINKNSLGLFEYFIIWYFLIILIIGYIYEWIKGGLDWE